MSDEREVWEETWWSNNDRDGRHDHVRSSGPYTVIKNHILLNPGLFERDRGDDEVDRLNNAVQLAAAAPELVRALLRVEWFEYGNPDSLDIWIGELCPICRSSKSGAMPSQLHKPGCDIDAALTKAGFADSGLTGRGQEEDGGLSRLSRLAPIEQHARVSVPQNDASSVHKQQAVAPIPFDDGALGR